MLCPSRHMESTAVLASLVEGVLWGRGSSGLHSQAWSGVGVLWGRKRDGRQGARPVPRGVCTGGQTWADVRQTRQSWWPDNKPEQQQARLATQIGWQQTAQTGAQPPPSHLGMGGLSLHCRTALLAALQSPSQERHWGMEWSEHPVARRVMWEQYLPPVFPACKGTHRATQIISDQFASGQHTVRVLLQ